MSRTYKNGFAPRDGHPLYPELWTGCTGAFSMGLGPTGLTLRDWSGAANHATLTNMDPVAAWAPNQGRYALTFDGTDDFVYRSIANYGGTQSRGAFTAWVRTSAAGYVVGTSDEGGNSNYVYLSTVLIVGNVFPNVQVESTANGFRNIRANTTPINDGNWHHIAVVSDSTAFSIFVDGIPQSLVAITGSNDGRWLDGPTNRDNFSIGSRRRIAPDGYFTGQIDDVRIYNRVLSPNAVRLLSQRRGIAYDMAPRRMTRVAVFKAAWAAREAQIIGGGFL